MQRISILKIYGKSTDESIACTGVIDRLEWIGREKFLKITGFDITSLCAEGDDDGIDTAGEEIIGFFTERSIRMENIDLIGVWNEDIDIGKKILIQMGACRRF